MLKKIAIDKILPYLIFVLSFTTYLLTLEQTVSFWDCGEFIASSFGLQIGHPPGAPLYAMSTRIMSALAPNTKSVALFINSFSALTSALTIVFLYKTILLLFEITSKSELSKKWYMQMSAFAASMIFAFSDSFWFSAVEAEVYAYSAFFTAVCFWAALKWYVSENGNLCSRWLILIAYLCGLSYGVHLLNLLIIPAITYLVISRAFELNTWKRWLVVAAASLAVGVVLYFFVPVILWFISRIELIFVNRFGFAYNSGTLVATAAIAAVFIWGIWYTYTKRMSGAFTFTAAFALFTLGFGSYAMVLIRGTQNPPMNQNQVDNIFSLKSYLDRDQYGYTPLVWGPYYSAPLKSVSKTEPIYSKVGGRYAIKGYKLKQHFYASHCTLFPRMYSSSPGFVESYRSWGNVAQEDSVTYKVVDGRAYKAPKPTFVQNLTYFGAYQMWWMYFRYLLWNFSGRQNDNLGQGNILNGNWITGFSFIDNLMLGDQSKLPDSMKSDKTANKYYLIPLLLGLIGVFYLSSKKEDVFISIMLLFFFTGIAIVLFINQTPLQVRERDYSYVGSFYVFAIWIAYGFFQVAKWLQKWRKPFAVNTLIAAFVSIPILVLSQNYDDHDRSDRSIALNYAKNYLNSLPPNSLLIVYGDNDTFPLWYAQMIEGIRTDVKVINSNYLFTTWNPGQLAQKTYENEGFRLKGDSLYSYPDELRFAVVKDTLGGAVPIGNAVTQLLDVKRKMPSPYRKDVNVHCISANQIVLPGLQVNDLSNIYLSKGTVIPKDQIVYLDILANNYSNRAICFAQTVPQRAYALFKPNISRVGLNFELRISSTDSAEAMNKRALLETYEFLTNRFSWDKFSSKSYYDAVSVHIIAGYRVAFMQTASAFLNEGDTLRAQNLMRLCHEKLPEKLIPLTGKQSEFVKLLYAVQLKNDASLLVNELINDNLAFLQFEKSLNSFQKRYVYAEKELALQNLENLASVLEEKGEQSLTVRVRTELDNYLSK